MFVYSSSSGMVVLLLYVDDIILTASTSSLLQFLLDSLKQEFRMTDLGKLHYFLGIEVQNLKEGLFLCQRKYAMDLINRACMLSCKPISTPLPTRPFSTTTDKPFSDPMLYRSIVGGLQYLTFTRPDLSYSVNLVCQFMHQPSEFH